MKAVCHCVRRVKPNSPQLHRAHVQLIRVQRRRGRNHAHATFSVSFMMSRWGHADSPKTRIREQEDKRRRATATGTAKATTRMTTTTNKTNKINETGKDSADNHVVGDSDLHSQNNKHYPQPKGLFLKGSTRQHTT